MGRLSDYYFPCWLLILDLQSRTVAAFFNKSIILQDILFNLPLLNGPKFPFRS